MFLFEPLPNVDMFNTTNPFLGSPSSATGMSSTLFPPSPSYDGDLDMMNTLLAFDPSLEACQPSTSTAPVPVPAPLVQQQPTFDFSQYVYPTAQQATMSMDAMTASASMPMAFMTPAATTSQAASMSMQFTPYMSPPFAAYSYNATYPMLLQQPPTSPPNTGKAALIPLPAEYPPSVSTMPSVDVDGLSPTQRAKKEMAHSEFAKFEGLDLGICVSTRRVRHAWVGLGAGWEVSVLVNKVDAFVALLRAINDDARWCSSAAELLRLSRARCWWLDGIRMCLDAMRRFAMSKSPCRVLPRGAACHRHIC